MSYHKLLAGICQVLFREKRAKETALIAAGIKVYSKGKASSAPLSQRRGSNWKFRGRLQSFSNRL